MRICFPACWPVLWGTEMILKRQNAANGVPAKIIRIDLELSFLLRFGYENF